MAAMSFELMLSRPAFRTSNFTSILRAAAQRLSQLVRYSGPEYGIGWISATVEAPTKTMRTVLGLRWNCTGGPRQPNSLVTSPSGDVAFGRKRKNGRVLPSGGSYT